MMQKITEITRRSIFDIFLNGIDLDLSLIHISEPTRPY